MLTNQPPTDHHKLPGGKQNSAPRFAADLFCVGIFLLALIFPNFTGHAQQPTPQSGSAQPVPVIQSVDTRDFPLIRTTFRVPASSSGAFSLSGAENIRVLENDEILQPTELREAYTGIHFALAINPSFSLALRDEEGVSNYQKMVDQIKSLRLLFNSSSADIFDLFINPDKNSVGLTSFDGFLSELEAYQENMRSLSGSLQSLETAIDQLAKADDSRDQVLIYLTEYIGLPQAAQFSELLTKAAQNSVRVHIWMVLDASAVETTRFAQMQQEATATGGSLTALTGAEEVPSPRFYFSGLGKTYTAVYASAVRNSGTNSLVIEAQTSQGITRSEPVTFDIEVLPPGLSFITLPEALAITIKAGSEPETLEPAELPIEVAISFPDNHPRGIQHASLWVNGTQVQQNNLAPYGSFVLPLAAYTQSSELRLEVRILDELGLEGNTETFSIPVSVIREKAGPTTPWFAQPWFFAVIGAGVLAFLTAALLPGLRKALAKPEPIAPLSTPPSPIPVKSLASLVRLDQDCKPAAEKPILIQEAITLIGNDPALSNLVLPDPSLDPLHAQLKIDPDGSARLTDFNSRAGTQVNFTPVTTRGIDLSHGDIIHFGRLLYRFNSSTRTMAAQAIAKNASPAEKQS